MLSPFNVSMTDIWRLWSLLCICQSAHMHAFKNCFEIWHLIHSWYNISHSKKGLQVSYCEVADSNGLHTAMFECCFIIRHHPPSEYIDQIEESSVGSSLEHWAQKFSVKRLQCISSHRQFFVESLKGLIWPALCVEALHDLPALVSQALIGFWWGCLPTHKNKCLFALTLEL